MSNIKERKFLSFTSHTLFLGLLSLTPTFLALSFKLQNLALLSHATHVLDQLPEPTHGVVRVQVYSSPFTLFLNPQQLHTITTCLSGVTILSIFHNRINHVSYKHLLWILKFI